MQSALTKGQTLQIAGPEEMLALGERLAAGLRHGQLVFLYGDLGSGKTTLVRGILRGLGYPGPVKSPTYTLVESYESLSLPVSHFDLYRLDDPRELEALAIRDQLDGQRICLVEWPERGAGVLPPADCRIFIVFAGPNERSVSLSCETELGQSLCACLE